MLRRGRPATPGVKPLGPGANGVGLGAVDPCFVFTDLRSRTAEETLADMAQRLAAAGVVEDAEELTRRLLEREQLGCTSLGSGVAIPHCKWKGLSEILVAIGSSRSGIDFHAADGVPVTLLFLILSPEEAPALHLQTLARISRLLRTPGVAESLRRASTPEGILEALRDAETALPVGTV
jgi:nitrogen PTS system EIIA component